MKIRIFDKASGYTGYSRNISGLASALKQLGVDIKIYQPDDGQPVPENVKDITFFDVNTGLQEIDKETIIVGRTYADIHTLKQFNPKMVCAIAVLEGDRIPEEWVAKANMIDQIWASSTYNKAMLEKNGVAVDIPVIWHGFDETIFVPLPNAVFAGMKFLFVGGYAIRGDRKGADLLAEAFNIFSKDDNVELIFKLNMSYNPTFDAVSDLKSLIKPELHDKVIFLTDYMADEQLASLYRNADVFVAPSLGDAFNQSILESFACGTPAIVTNYSGYLDYCMDEFTIKIPMEKRIIASYGMFDIPSGSVWVKPSMTALKEELMKCYKKEYDLILMGKKASEYVHSRLTWRHMAERTMSVIQKNLHD